MNKILLIVVTILVNTSLFAQSGMLAKGDSYFQKLGYHEAIQCYEKVLGTEFDSPEMQGKLAYSYLVCGSFANAEKTYQKLTSSRKQAEDFYYLAYAQMCLNKNTDAAKNFQQFITLKPADYRAKLFVQNPNYLSDLLKEAPYFAIKPVSINTNHADFGVYPNTATKKAVIVSSRRRTVFGDIRWAGNNDYFLEYFRTDLTENGGLSKPRHMCSRINSGRHEGPLCFSADGKTVYFTSNNRNRKSKKLGKDGIQHLNIYIADVVNNKWKNVREFAYNSQDYATGHPVLSTDGKTLYFVSDMPGGFGGADIYSVSVLPDGGFSKPINLGVNVNTEGQEMFPWIYKDLLFFASNGRPGFGGLDLFVKPLAMEIAAKNAGKEINTVSDDFALTLMSDNQFGFVASNRTGGQGSDDIYSAELLRPFVFSTLFKGTAIDAQTGAILANATVKITDPSGKVIATLQTDDKGQFSIPLEPGKTYAIATTKDGYENNLSKVEIPTNKELVEQKLPLAQVPNYAVRLLVSDSKTKKPISNVKVVIKDLTRNEVLIDETTDADGDVMKKLERYAKNDQLNLSIDLVCPGYLAKNVTYNDKITAAGIIQLHEKLNVDLQAIEVGGDLAKMLEIKPIYFDLNKFNIRPDAAIELEKIIKVMNENPTMVIELGSHTDCRGSVKSNETLSSNRAKSSANYIKARITNPERISGRGYGESKLLNDCGCEGAVKSTCTEEQHQLNRRTEFIIIKM